MLKLTPKSRVLFVRRFTPVLLALFGVFALLLINFIRLPGVAHAATANTINFQARLQSSNGAIVPDGYYNVEFKLYGASSGGTALWTEDYLVGTGHSLQTINGYLSANLGSQTAFSGINWDQQLWMTMNIGGTSGSVVATSSSTSGWDGEMNPRLPLTAVPYAFTAGNLATTSGSNRSTLSIQAPTGGDQNFVIQDQGAAGTYNLLTTAQADAGYIQLQASPPGTAQHGNFNIDGSGIASILQAGTFDAASTGTLSIGTSNATSISLGKSGVNTSVVGTLSINNASPNASNQLTINTVTTSGSTEQAAQALISTGGTGNYGLIIQGVAGQGASLIRLEDYHGNLLGGFTSNGNVISQVGLQSNDSGGTDTSSITITTGDATGAGKNSGSVTVDSGVAAGTTGGVYVGNTNASSITVGHSGITTTIAGTASLTGNVGINNTSSANPLAINGVTTSNSITSAAQLLLGTGGSNNNGLIIQMASSQVSTTYPIAVLSSSGNIVAGINATGDFVGSGNFRTANSATGNTSGITVKSGDASGTSTNSGDVNIDSGTATGTAGVVNLGTANASSLNLGRSGVTTTVGGTLQSPVINATTGFQINGTAGSTTTCTTGDVLSNVVVQGGIITDGTCAANGGGVAPTLQNVYDNSATTPVINLGATGKGLFIQDASTTVGGNLFAVQDSTGSNQYLAVTTSGISTSGTAAANAYTVTAGNGLDTATAGNLNLGTTTANGVTIGRSSTYTTLQGTTLIGGGSVANNSSTLLNISNTYTSGYIGGSNYGIDNTVLFTPSSASVVNIYGTNTVTTVGGSNTFSAVNGVSTRIGIDSGYTGGAIARGSGVSIQAPSFGSAGQYFTDYRGIDVAANGTNGGNTSGTVANYQIRVSGITAGAGAGGTLNNYGVYITQPAGSGGTTNNYGLYINGSGGGSSNYSIYNASTALSYFAGSISSDGGYLGPSIDAASAATTLNVGTTNANLINVGGSNYSAVNIGATGTTGANTGVNIGTSTDTIHSQSVTIGSNTNSGSATTVNGYTLTLQSSNAVNITSTTAGGAITVGATNQSGTITIGQSTSAANTINIGNGLINAIQTINIGNSATGSGSDVVTIGSLYGASTTTIQGGTGNVNLTTNSSAAGVIVKSSTNSATAFVVQNSSSQALFTVDTSTGTITFGNGSNTIVFTAAGGLVASGTAQHVKSIVLPAEYAGAVLDAASDSSCSSANSGTLTSGFDSTNRMNYYNWTASGTTSQCYDVVVQVPIPQDWASWSASDPFNLQVKASNTSNASVSVQVLDTTNTADTYWNYGSMTIGTSWSDAASTGFASTNYSAGNYMTVKIRMSAKNAASLQLGTLTLNYNSKY